MSLIIAAVVLQAGWSAPAQMARIKKEDDAFFRHLPKNNKKREEAIALHLRLPMHERILEGWAPSYESKGQPHALKLKSGANVAGKWQRTRGSLGAAFVISGGPAFTVSFHTWDPKGGIVFRRKAQLKGSTLTLNRPVFDTIDRPFTKLYVVQVGKGLALLPSADVPLLDRMAKTPSERAKAIAGLTFKRA
ncbi:MAG: hypothetical protein QOJ65_1636 [Fimbriimonadaceae bacterium]|jgi:hypothetical protein|nr:hypothetical protein [Fimbriimonadaceae bacterium]